MNVEVGVVCGGVVSENGIITTNIIPIKITAASAPKGKRLAFSFINFNQQTSITHMHRVTYPVGLDLLSEGVKQPPGPSIDVKINRAVIAG